jgi:hypothetical protein
MANNKAFTLPENDNPLNQAALEWLMEARADAPTHYLYLLSLAAWGLEKGVASGWKERAALQEQVDSLFGWKAENALHWILSNLDAGPKEEQQANLHKRLETSDHPQNAAKAVLETIFDRQVNANPALQPAASELS